MHCRQIIDISTADLKLMNRCMIIFNFDAFHFAAALYYLFNVIRENCDQVFKATDLSNVKDL